MAAAGTVLSFSGIALVYKKVTAVGEEKYYRETEKERKKSRKLYPFTSSFYGFCPSLKPGLASVGRRDLAGLCSMAYISLKVSGGIPCVCNL